MLKVTLEDIMTEDVVTLKEGATIGQAAHILLRFRINGVMIVKKDDHNKVLGIITTTDLLKLLGEALSRPRQKISELHKIALLPAARFFSGPVISVQKDAKLEKVIAIMHKRNKHTIPVFDGDKLVGVVGRHDILNAAFG